MITEQQIEDAFEWLRNNENTAAKARAERVYLDEFRKALKAMLMLESDATTIGEREAFAYSHSRYTEHLEKIKVAVFDDERHRAAIKRLEWMIEFWRSQESSRRAMGKVG